MSGTIWPYPTATHRLCEAFHKLDPVKQQTPTKQIAAAIDDGWLSGGSFLNSILAGTLLGFLLDRWLDTSPWLIIAGVVLGSYAGFVQLWRLMKQQDQTGDR